jgi:ribosome maturation factor RimP
MDERAQRIVAEVEALAEPLLMSEGITLIDIEYRRERHGWILRVIMDKDGGVTLEDCTDISHQLGDILDVKVDFLGPYHMEVSSPGLDRALTKPKHFKQFKGRQVVIRTHWPVEGTRDVKGVLGGFSDGAVMLAIGDQTLGIPYENIVKARLDY